MTKNKILTFLRKNPALVGFIGIFIILSIISDSFLSIYNITNILRQTSIISIIGFGMTLVILTGGIDLSVGSTFALSAVIMASIVKAGNPILGIIVALLVGSAIGALNGIIISKGKIQPFIVTLAMMAIARSLTLGFTEGIPISGFSSGFRFLGRGDFLGIPMPIIIMFIVFFITYYILKKTRLGLYTYSIGGNEEATKLSGVNVDKYKIIIYMISGLFSAISAIILTARLNSAQPTFGTGYELDAIATVVLGGASLAGGYGGVFGTLFGALLLGTINNGMNLLNVSPFYQDAVKGVIILIAVLLEKED
ncbi:ribose ABC transporter permease [Oceanotoga sp. DSM 15011]|jgi:ribose transport system permease protein|uniref:Monosaccharide ABC transporter membrane protein (CUT2 family) n=1 Tax=Oceanotoga teriensis TaxID=515440 RepID=A0AA45C764_9BACT|nr:MULTISPECIES: ribose ABC transporter permease [Oceanotoga]MDN5341414.1 ribose transport system permease protein [Oceanotoga sp.]MDO7975897.1 ribose ABC transporter permease [Oceanotoga teriensis]PWJ95126.1 monosaccharide ABC transporter membrane protein (CUT2 family) [Oceanotoga teriensis]UYO99118.1 ribose ABC transporter permease [Oceanotoga sp. DSM 15011]